MENASSKPLLDSSDISAMTGYGKTSADNIIMEFERMGLTVRLLPRGRKFVLREDFLKYLEDQKTQKERPSPKKKQPIKEKDTVFPRGNRRGPRNAGKTKKRPTGAPTPIRP